MSLGAVDSVETRLCFPRVSGDEPFLLNDVATRWVFSPRERG